MKFDSRSAMMEPEGDGRGNLAGSQSYRRRRDTADETFHRQIEALIPRLTRYAQVLTRDAVAAEDLVQDGIMRALGKIHLWEPGTDLRAWLFTILHHQHISLTRRNARQRASAQLQQRDSGFTQPANQMERLELRDLERAMAKLPEEVRSVVLLVGLEGMQYDEAAALANQPIGTVRSRVARGRETLREMTELFPTRHARRPAKAENAPQDASQ